MVVDASLVSKRFAEAQASYDAHAVVQHQVFLSLLDRLCDYQNHFEHILDIGCGDGSKTTRLKQVLEAQSIVGIDACSALIAKADKSPEIDFYTLDFDHELDVLNRRFDLIVSNMALQWSKDLPGLLHKLTRFLKPESMVALSLPLTGTFAELQGYFRINAFYACHELNTLISNAGFEVIDAKEQLFTLQFQSRRAQLEHLRLTGVNCYTGNKPRHTVAHLRACLNDVNPINLSYRVGTFIARFH
ncbi:MAG: methyltransferase domain-containing protein [Francisellaceae bacterium]